ncbi:hypothetical protein SGQ83_07815 [Flavobacterium sp. Fl-318]|uniref:Mobilization protein n=1 Tax=Flavobacterium cupriresistens TaxID=2893885 RepID=A0ABU4R9I7_9FLAO|nr:MULTISPECIES: hypothetical protein [unclassified Flavobacterium]MDX6189248.1 hypothetical protein [Flavobacterium sp. Fl-318]UFH41344.1 hypothetical protein LNP23_16185 [Flavobacterium sp. F-323]
MSKYDFESTNAMLDSLKKSFDSFLKEDVAVNSFDKITETDFGKEVARIFNQHSDNHNAKNLDFQYKKIVHIANDIQHLKLANDATLPDWLEEELEAVFKKTKGLLTILKEELN